MGTARNTNGGDEKHILVGKPEERDHLAGLGLCGRTIVK